MVELFPKNHSNRSLKVQSLMLFVFELMLFVFELMLFVFELVLFVFELVLFALVYSKIACLTTTLRGYKKPITP